MIKKRITVIGAGKMGQAIVQCLLEKHAVVATNIIVTTPTLAALDTCKNTWDIASTTDNIAAIAHADIILLAVKPQGITQVLRELQPHIHTTQLVLSIAAGVSLHNIQDVLGTAQPIVRIMPNLCAQVGESFSAWIKTAAVTSEQVATTKIILQTIGIEIELKKESLMNVVTAVSGSGPAYVFYLTELLESAAITHGLPPDVASILARQTIIGSSSVLAHSQKPAAVLRSEVTSKGGTTEAAFIRFEKDTVGEKIMAGITDAYKKAADLAL